VAEELYERGDPAFVGELRRIHDPDRLGSFAAKWYADKRPAARQLLLKYVELPYNVFRHEALVKRLYKLAEKWDDVEVLVRFLAGFDRSIRRVRKKKHHYDWQTQQSWTTETMAIPSHVVMPRDYKLFYYRNPRTGERMAAPTEDKQAAMGLFTLRTRRYLRRRVWRYFRKNGKLHPEKYVTAVVQALLQYTDDDTPDGLALIDNWGLCHLLFHHSPVLIAAASGWKLAEGKMLAELTPAPAFEDAWKKSAAPLIQLLLEAKCRPVRQWSMQLLRRDHAGALASLPLRNLLQLLSHEDADLAMFAVEALAASTELSSLKVDEWLSLLETASPQTLDPLCELVARHLDPRVLSLQQIVALACSRPMPVAKLGFAWLQGRSITTVDECRLVGRVADAEAELLRPEMVSWLRTAVAASLPFQSEFLLDLLDSRHVDVRREGWAWFIAEPQANQDVVLWQKLLESPYDDVRLAIVPLLEERARPALTLSDRGRLEPATVRLLWATVLLNTQRGGKAKPRVVAQIADRLVRRPDEAAILLPLLGAALRSIRGPEFRAGLAAVVQLVEQQPELEPLVKAQFPELRLVVLS
jgi:hypothetical protein